MKLENENENWIFKKETIDSRAVQWETPNEVMYVKKKFQIFYFILNENEEKEELRRWRKDIK